MPKYLTLYRSRHEQPFSGAPKFSNCWEKILLSSTSTASLALVQNSSLRGRIRSILQPTARHEVVSKTGAAALATGFLLAAATVGGLAEPSASIGAASLDGASTLSNEDAVSDAIDIRADHMEAAKQGLIATGHVILKTRNVVLTADRLTLNSSTGAVVAQGHAICTKGQHKTITLEPAATLTLDTKTHDITARGKHKSVLEAAPPNAANAENKN